MIHLLCNQEVEELRPFVIANEVIPMFYCHCCQTSVSEEDLEEEGPDYASRY